MVVLMVGWLWSWGEKVDCVCRSSGPGNVSEYVPGQEAEVG